MTKKSYQGNRREEWKKGRAAGWTQTGKGEPPFIETKRGRKQIKDSIVIGRFGSRDLLILKRKGVGRRTSTEEDVSRKKNWELVSKEGRLRSPVTKKKKRD